MTQKPTSAIVAVLDICDSKCVMCNIWKDGRGGEVPASYFEKLPEELKSVNITGGEPFLRRDLPEVIGIIKKRCHNPRIVISSNGFQTDLIIKQMKAIQEVSDRVGIRISLDGVGEMHDKVRGVEGVFEKCMTTLKALKALPVPDLGVSFTIVSNDQADNSSDIINTYNLSRDLGIEFTMTIAVNSGFYFKTSSNKPMLDPKEIKKQLTYIATEEIKQFHPKRLMRAYYAKGLYDYILGERVLYDCKAASSFFFSSAHGEIYPCPFLSEHCGDLKDGSFDDVWESDKIERVREIAKDCPSKCWATCTAGPYLRRNKANILLWILKSKLKAHLGKDIL